ncbi:MAG: hypothetical protein K0R10_1232 [Alphaproteobacteria bacterium]|jgi:hypothetical protein|nr:hypothetical protein [Alphaproteobacteria bacterium]
MKRLGDAALRELLEISKATTPRPWYFHHRDDSLYMNAYLISTEQVENGDDIDYDPETMVAGTLIQSFLPVQIGDKKSKQNTEYLIAAANNLPAIIEELLELREKVGDN